MDPSHGPMVMRVARHGRNAGGSFWGCSTWPKTKCPGLLDVSRDESGGADAGASRTKSAVTWIDGTLDRPGWSCRYTTIGGSLRALPGSADLGANVAQSWVARTEGGTLPSEDVQRVVGVCRKILQRGTAPPIHPDAEAALLAKLGLTDSLVASRLPGDLRMKLSNARN